MLNNPYQHDDRDILERLRHPERETERRKMSRNLFLRKILNLLFILLAVVAMGGILLADAKNMMPWYIVGLFAVIVKMVEVMLRMPGIKK